MLCCCVLSTFSFSNSPFRLVANEYIPSTAEALKIFGWCTAIEKGNWFFLPGFGLEFGLLMHSPWNLNKFFPTEWFWVTSFLSLPLYVLVLCFMIPQITFLFYWMGNGLKKLSQKPTYFTKFFSHSHISLVLIPRGSSSFIRKSILLHCLIVAES